MARHVCIELSVARDLADDRPLGKSGEFLSGTYGQDDIAEFASVDAAFTAAAHATRRPDSEIWVSGSRRKAAA